MLRILDVSASGYYKWLHHKPGQRALRKKRIVDQIKQIYAESHQIYGAPKITVKLRRNGHKISEKTVGNYMRENNLKACYISPYTRTTYSEDFSSRLTNILRQRFNPEKPNAAWCTDITYIKTRDDGFVYLTSIMDLYSRKIICWEVSSSLSVEAVVKTVESAKKERNHEEPLVIHSDRGIQFTSHNFIEATAGMIRSYSAKGYPYDNACIEAFHSVIKREWLNRFSYSNIEEVRSSTFEYINTFYNTVRIHSHCQFLSPFEYENAYFSRIASV